MSDSWLDGDLSGVAPRAELALLRQTLIDALERGEDVSRMVIALTRLDPVAGAELVAGARAIPDARVVRAALQVAAELEGVLPTAGLYRRMADLAPDELGNIMREAAARHLGEGWWWRLSAREQVPGSTALALAAVVDADTAPHRALDHGYLDAVSQRAGAGDPASLRAIYDKAPREALLRALIAVLEGGAHVPIVPWLAAWHGPDVDPIFAAVARRLRAEPARRRLAAWAQDLPATAEALRARG